MLSELIQANEIVFMNFKYIELCRASFGDGIDDKMNHFKHQMVIQYILIINRRLDA